MQYVPVTPGGTPLMEEAASTEEEAWANLLCAAVHMPYADRAELEASGYTVEECEDDS